jgi:tetratricopeptide (TPR) repeat protein
MHSPETIFKAIEHLVVSGHKEAALWAMGKILLDFPENARLHSEMAALAYEQADMQNALLHFKQAAELEPQNSLYLKDLGDYYYVVEKDAEGALDQYESVLNIDPNNVDTLIMAGHVSTSLHRYSQGQKHYQRALALDPQNTEVRKLLEKLNHPAQDKSSSTSTMSVDELYDAAQAKFQEADRETAISLLEQLLAQDDSHALAHNDLGVLFYESGNLQAALTHYEKAAGLQPENEIFQKNLADFYLAAMGDHEKALERYLQALKLNPRDVEALIGCGQICMGLGKDEDARDFLNVALETEPWNENAQQMLRQLEQGSVLSDQDDNTDLYEKAKAKASKGDLHGAINDLNRYVSGEPNNATAYNDLGVLYFETGDKNKTLASYEKAVQLDPNDHTYRKNLADFYLIEQGRAEEAMKLYLMVLEEYPQDIEALIACGMVCTASAKTEDAKFFYQRVLEIEPWNEIANNALNDLKSIAEGNDGERMDTVATG